MRYGFRVYLVDNMAEVVDNSGIVGRFKGFIDRKFPIDKIVEIKPIYQYPKTGKAELWVENMTKLLDFKALHYLAENDSGVEEIRTIPETKTHTRIHFLPSALDIAFNRKRPDEEPAHENLPNSIKTVREAVPAFVDFLNAVRNGEFADIENIVGSTNYKMANAAVGLGFKRCWEDDKGYDDDFIPTGIRGEATGLKGENCWVAVSVADLRKMYDLDTHAPTEESVIATIKNLRLKPRPTSVAS